MKKQFKGRPLLAGQINGQAAVSRVGFNTLASFRIRPGQQTPKEITCTDANNPDLFGKPLTGKMLALPQTIGSTSAGLVLASVASLDLAPAALLFAKHIDSLAASGIILAEVWYGKKIITIDQLGQEFLDTIKEGDQVSVTEDGLVTIQ